MGSRREREKIYRKNHATLLNKKYAYWKFYLSKEVMWVSVCQRDAKLQAGKAVGSKEICHTASGWPEFDIQTMGSSLKFGRQQICSPLTYRYS